MPPHSAHSLTVSNCERDAKLREQALHLLFAIKLLIESSNKETGSSFADLPDDIIRNIIALSGDPYSLRLISQKWNFIVLDYTTSRFLVIDRLEVRVGADDEFSIKIRLPMKWLGYFNPNEWKMEMDNMYGKANLTSNWNDSSAFSKIVSSGLKTFGNSFLVFNLLSMWITGKREKKQKEAYEASLELLRQIFKSTKHIKALSFYSVKRTNFESLCNCLGSVRIDYLKVGARDDVRNVDFKSNYHYRNIYVKAMSVNAKSRMIV